MFEFRAPLHEVCPLDGCVVGGAPRDPGALSREHYAKLVALHHEEQERQLRVDFTYGQSVDSWQLDDYFRLKGLVFKRNLAAYNLQVVSARDYKHEYGNRYRSEVAGFSLEFQVQGTLEDINRFARRYGLQHTKGTIEKELDTVRRTLGRRTWCDDSQNKLANNVAMARKLYPMVDITWNQGRVIPVGQRNRLSFSGPRFFVTNAIDTVFD